MYLLSVKQFGSRSVGPDLGPNCLQRKLAENIDIYYNKKLTGFQSLE